MTATNPFEHLQDTIRRLHNKEVSQYFKSTPIDSIATPKASLRTASTINDTDTVDMTVLRLFLFWVMVRKLRDSTDLVYGIPIEDYAQTFKFRPQIFLAFAEPPEDVDPEYYACTGQITFRLMDETSTSLSQGKLKTFATKIKSEFATPRYTWRKGKDCYSYRDLEKGYQLKLFCRSESDAKDLISSVLDIQTHTPDWDLLRLNKATEESGAFPTNPGSQSILGKSKKKPRKRPIADVKFVAATAQIWGFGKPIYLVDTTGFHRDALETVY